MIVMNRFLRWKVISILVVFVVFGAVGVYPLVATLMDLPAPRWLMSRKLPLGLDLQGGVQFAIRVETGYALRSESEAAINRLRESLQTAGAGSPSLTLVDATHFRIDGVVPELDAAFREAASSTGPLFERQAGSAGDHTFAMTPAGADQLREETVTRTRETIERRINELGVSEPSVARQGQNGDQILIQLPGVTNVERAKEIIQAGGVLELKLVEQVQAVSAGHAGSDSPRLPDTEVLEGRVDDS
jgi:preprotein translocase subunit SecD